MKRERKPVVTFTSAGEARCPSCKSGLRIGSRAPDRDARLATCPSCGNKYAKDNRTGKLRLIEGTKGHEQRPD